MTFFPTLENVFELLQQRPVENFGPHDFRFSYEAVDDVDVVVGNDDDVSKKALLKKRVEPRFFISLRQSLCMNRMNFSLSLSLSLCRLSNTDSHSLSGLLTQRLF